MGAKIYAVDTEKRDSEGQTLAVRGAQLEIVLKRYDGLPFGQHRDQHYIEVQAISWEGAAQSTLVAQLNAGELERLFNFAYEQGLIAAPVDRRIVQLVEQLREVVATGNSVQQ